MRFEEFKRLMDHHIFDRQKHDLLKNVGEKPERFVGIFRATKPAVKIQQSLLQSREIRFGNAMETIIRQYIQEMEFENVPNQVTGDDGSRLIVDQLFRSATHVWFVEQKVRDDHDSTKKRGQIENFQKKALTLRNLFDESVSGIMYFIDPTFTKNERYYRPEVLRLSRDLDMEMNIFYGVELFEHFQNREVWDELTSYLRRWKEEMPDYPPLNFDADVEDTLLELQAIELRTWKKIASNDEIWREGIINVLFPTGAALRAIAERLRSTASWQHKKVAEKLMSRIETYYR